VDKFSVEAYGVDGVGIVFTMRLADRQGNPVPDGTAVNFVSENGVMKPASCLTVSSLCTSTLNSQGARPTNGLVSVMAYTPGEEDFTDSNSDNEYTAGEPFTDLGNAFRDDAATSSGANGTYVAGSFQLPRSGSATCAGGYAGRPNTCDGVWGAVDVRRTVVAVWATSEAYITNPTWTRAVDGNYDGSPIVATQLAVDIADFFGNAVPDGSTISVSATDKTPLAPALTGTNGAISYFSCSATFSGSALKNTILPARAVFSLNTCVAGDKIEVTVTAPSGTKTTQPFTVP
jgi:hypothetical protein